MNKGELEGYRIVKLEKLIRYATGAQAWLITKFENYSVLEPIEEIEWMGRYGEKKEAASHRYDRLPLLPSGPGGFSRSWSCR